MFERCFRVQGGFQWRAETGRWRWLILGALGVAPAGCGGRTDNGEADPSPTDIQSQAGARAGGGGVGFAETASGGTGGGGTGSGGSGPIPAPSACEPPLTDLGGGWERCANGMIHRQALGSCPSSVPRPEAEMRAYPDTSGVPALCRYDSDCTEGPYGHCEVDDYAEGGTYCAYGCVTNADCEPGYACVCGVPVGTCQAASCATDAECGDGLLCSDYITHPGCGGRAFACQQDTDTCAAQSDCPQDQFCARGNYAEVIPRDAPRHCSPAQCVVGRPFLVAGEERLAAAVARSDWYPARRAGAPCPGLDRELRAAVARGWLEQALMEHASVAAFARFSLQLLALGAPSELCSQSARAMRDELEHARACFDQARRHSDADVGPGPLGMAGALDNVDLESVLLGTIAEGCIGETVAAIEAAEALAHCGDEAARSTLARIADDETRHAELAWRFVAWALEVGPPALRETARAAFASAAASSSDAAPSSPGPLDGELAQHGLIAAPLRAELRRRVLRDVIEPCARALLGSPCAELAESVDRRAGRARGARVGSAILAT